jgi:hypothetical protein
MKFTARTTKSPTNAQNTGQIAFFVFSPLSRRFHIFVPEFSPCPNRCQCPQSGSLSNTEGFSFPHYTKPTLHYAYISRVLWFLYSAARLHNCQNCYLRAGRTRPYFVGSRSIRYSYFV